jgi:hypothetical protein
MKQVLEFHGRLRSTSGSAPLSGRFDLIISVHKSEREDQAIWVENHRAIDVDNGGAFSVVLGLETPFPTNIADQSHRWVSVAAVQADGDQVASQVRTPLVLTTLRLASELSELTHRVDHTDGILGVERGTGHHLALLEGMLAELEQRIGAIETSSNSAILDARIASLEESFRALTGDDGRLERIEDEIEDLVGPDGDVVDLNDRMDVLEQRLGDEEAQPAGARETFELMRVQLAALERRLDSKAPKRPPVVVATDPSPVLRAAFLRADKVDLQPGDVVVASGGAVAACQMPADRRVVGVYLGEPAPAAADGGARVMVAVAGVVSVRVDGDTGPIDVGDLLVTSSRPGHACADPAPAAGTVIGKALDAVASGSALLRVLLFPR